MGIAESRQLRIRLARSSSTADVALALRLRGLDPRGPWPQRPHGAIVRGQTVQPDPVPGYLWIDGERRYSADWL